MHKHVYARYPANPLLPLRPHKFDSFHIHAPMVVKEDGRYRMWYSGSDRTPNEYHRIGYAESRDGVTWERMDEPVLVPGAVARSEDGIHWEKDGGPILSPDPGSSYDSLYCSNASVIPEPDGRDKLYYASRIDMDHRYYAIGLAVREPTP